MALLYVRTGNTGTDPDVLVPDLGATILTSASWTLLSASSPSQALGSAGQFSARDLRDSQDLYDFITGGTLEWSQDGAILTSAGSYDADFMLAEDLSNNSLAGAISINDLTDADTTTTPPFVGALLGFDGYNWVPLEGSTMYNKEIDEITGGDLYVGEALPGTLTSEAKWRIQFVDFTKSGSLEDISITWADGNALFDNIWDNRLGLSYS
jgi:hypothetical protein